MLVMVIGIVVFVAFVLTTLLWENSFLNRYRREIIQELFEDKDLPVLKEIKIAKDFSIKLYGLKYKDEKSQVFDKTDLTYLRLVKLINNNINIDFVGEGEDISADIQLTDFTLKENEHQYIELIEMVTNFNLAQFVFKGEDKFKLLNLESDIIKEMKEHTDAIIHLLFLHTIDLIQESGNSEMLEKAFSRKFLNY